MKKKINYSFRIDEMLLDKVKAVAAVNDRSIGDMLRILITAGLKAHTENKQ